MKCPECQIELAPGAKFSCEQDQGLPIKRPSAQENSPHTHRVCKVETPQRAESEMSSHQFGIRNCKALRRTV